MSEIKKYVRIKRAYSKGAWYANQIGSVFPSLGTWENAYKVDSPDRALYIRQEDAELIVTEKRPANRNDRILITNADTVHGLYKNGDELVVDGQHKFGNGVFAYKEYDVHRLDCHYVTYKEYEVIVNNEEADEMENIEKRYDTAVENMNTATENLIAEIEELRLAAYAQGYEDARRALLTTAGRRRFRSVFRR
ncbi:MULTISPECIES: hypothetical protein [Bacillus]|uniref:Uncharacterized protein n=1 Tax=Bacillus glycinifermentans TaxID=1664069 RepID=A0A0T6BV54_9BACI|nr:MULTISPECIES: hypothetical protein [Bacillus]ARC67965.1 hypothetical protein B34_00522 [Bacillus licheniformis]KRT95513.1 hypothetical protein AB447_209440 [Bacillus glycinifermentans]MBK4208773.1 hypothetical protein [Bacillus licheniformis]MDE1421458.1 hypothetical protein [Bacillus licheniformis]MEC0487293.1 hypothetical protein [Bacillus glycinifermentans]